MLPPTHALSPTFPPPPHPPLHPTGCILHHTTTPKPHLFHAFLLPHNHPHPHPRHPPTAAHAPLLTAPRPLCARSKTKQWGHRSAFADVAVRCTACCLWCLEKILRLVSAYAYTFVALNGDTFCMGCRDTWRLLLTNQTQTTAIALVQTVLFSVQSILKPVISGVACYRLVQTGALAEWSASLAPYTQSVTTSLNGLAVHAHLHTQHLADLVHVNVTPAAPQLPTDWLAMELPTGDLPEPIWPAIAAFVLAFAVARSFASVYECVVDTIFVCAMRDKDEFGSSHMSESLRDALGLGDGHGPSSSGTSHDASQQRSAMV